MPEVNYRVLRLVEDQLRGFEEKASQYLNELNLSRKAEIVRETCRAAGLRSNDPAMEVVERRIEEAKDRALKEVCDSLKATLSGNVQASRPPQVFVPNKRSDLTRH